MNDIYDARYKTAMHLLKEKRLSAGLTQKELADKLGCAQSYVSKFEAGQVRLDIIEMRTILGNLGISLVQYVEELEKAIGK